MVGDHPIHTTHLNFDLSMILSDTHYHDLTCYRAKIVC